MISYKVFFVIVSLTFLLLQSGCSGRVIEDYPAAIKWDNKLYGVSGEVMPKEKIGKQIGTISKIVDDFPKENGEANDLLYTPLDSKLYEVTESSIEEIIAVKIDDNRFRVLNRILAE